MFEYPELARKYLLENYYLIDLHIAPEEKLKKDKQAALVELLLKQGKLKDFSKWLDKHKAFLQELDSPYAEEAFLYILSVHNRDKTFKKLKQNTNPQQQEVIMSIAERLVHQGHQQDMQTKSIEIARNMLQKREPQEKVVEFTGLSKTELEKLAREIALK